MTRILASLFLVVAMVGHAATYVCPNGTALTVQSNINLTINGDAVVVPAGNWAWTTNLVITNNIEFLGTGIGSTIVTDSVPRACGSSDKMVLWTMVSNTTARPLLSGFEFRGDINQSCNPFTGMFWIQGTCFTFRVCSNFFNTCYNRDFQWHGWVYGSIDHNIHITGNRAVAEIWHDGYGGGSFGDKSWEAPDLMGTTNCVVVEDNIIWETGNASGGGIDMMGGARVTVRFNNFSNCVDSTHGTESTGRIRSLRVLESYNNSYKQVSGMNASAGQFRGGTGLVCSNTYVGPDWSGGKQLTYYRELGPFNTWGGAANGTNGYDTNSATVYYQGTHTGANGATVLTDAAAVGWTVNGWASTNMLWNVTTANASKINSNTGTTITYDLGYNSVVGSGAMTFNTGDTYRIMSVIAGIDQPGRGQQANGFTPGSNPATPVIWGNEALAPIYSWSNTLNGVLGMNVGSSYPSVLAGREYYANTIKPGWTPLVYPNPLAGGSNAPPATTSKAIVTTLRSGHSEIRH